MFKKICLVVLATAAFCSPIAFANDELKSGMQDMAKAVKAVDAATTNNEALTALNTLLNATEFSRNQFPDDLDLSDENILAYDGYFVEVIYEVETAIALVENNKLDDAKAVISKIADMRNKAHQQFK